MDPNLKVDYSDCQHEKLIVSSRQRAKNWPIIMANRYERMGYCLAAVNDDNTFFFFDGESSEATR